MPSHIGNQVFKNLEHRLAQCASTQRRWVFVALAPTCEVTKELTEPTDNAGGARATSAQGMAVKSSGGKPREQTRRPLTGR